MSRVARNFFLFLTTVSLLWHRCAAETVTFPAVSTKISPYWHCCAEVCPERIKSCWNVCNHSRGGQWWEVKWLLPVHVLEEMSTSGSHLRWSPSSQPLWKSSLIDNRDAATISPGGGERTPVEQHGETCYCCCPSQICLAGLLRRTRQWFNPPALQDDIFIFPTGLTPASAMSCNSLLIKGSGRTSSNLESSTGQGIH